MTEYRTYHNYSWNGFISSELNDMDLVPERLEVQGEMIVSKPNRMVRRMDLSGMTVYAKWFAPSKNIFKRLFRKPLVFKLLDIHQALLASGIGCAEPLFAAISGKASQNLPQLFIYKEVPYPSISKRLQNASADEAAHFYAAAAKAIAVLHNAGFVHGDCLPGNICLSDDGRSFFIDNDRTSRSLPFLRQRQECRNLIQFCAHAAHQHNMPREMQSSFLLQYFECRSVEAPQTKYLLDRMEVRCQEIKREEAKARW